MKRFFLFLLKKKKGLDKLIQIVNKYIPYNDWIFEQNQLTDEKLEFLLSEITREKIFELLNQELPYNIKIETEIFKNKISQYIFVKKSSQKPIFIGKKGEKIKKIGTRSRKEMEIKLNKKIFLDLKVKLKK